MDKQEGPTISINRPAYTQSQFNRAFNIQELQNPPIATQVKNYVRSKVTCSGECAKNWILGMLPIICVLKDYKWKKWILRDIIAGLSIGVIHIPQGMGFALLTELTPVYGLYSSIFPVWVYTIFGTSKHISMGTMALISLMIGSVVNQQIAALPRQQYSYITTTMATTVNDTMLLEDKELEEFRVDIATSVSLLVGLFQIAMYLCKLGFVVSYMSGPFVNSFMAGAAIHIITSQVPTVLGVPLERFSGMYSVGRTWIELFKRIQETNLATLVTSVICLAILVFFKEFINIRFKKKLKVPVPVELFVVLVSITISHFCELNSNFGIAVIGSIPTGIPAPRTPSLHNFTDYIVDSAIIAIVAFVISITMAKMMSRKHNYEIDVQQEILAYGLQNSVASFFHCFSGTQAPPRTLIHESTGGKTQLANLASTILPLLVVFAIGPLFHSLPNCVLAAIIIAALIPLLKKFAELGELWRINRNDFILWVVTLLTMAIFSIITGLVVGLACNIFLVVLQSQFASGKLRSSPHNIDIYVDDETRKNTKAVKEPQDVKVFYFDSDLYFPNVEIFKSQILAATLNSEGEKNTCEDDSMKGMSIYTSKVHSDSSTLEKATNNKLATVVLDCSAICYIDIMGINTLKDLATLYAESGIKFVLATCTPGLTSKLKAAGLLGVKGESGVCLVTYPSVVDAVNSNTHSQRMIAIL